MISWEPSAFGLLLVLFRCTSLMMTAPIIGMNVVPGRIRMGLSVLVSFIAYQAAGAPRFEAWDHMMPLLSAAATELIIGLSAGLASKFTIEAAGAAGHAAGLSMGLGFSAIVDPIHGQESTALSQMLIFVTVGAAVTLGVHRDAIAWLCRSVIETPPGTPMHVQQLAGVVIGEAARSVSLSIRLAFPVMAAVLFGYVGAGMLSRTAPQLKIESIGFGVAMFCGGCALYYISPVFAEVVARQAHTFFVEN